MVTQHYLLTLSTMMSLLMLFVSYQLWCLHPFTVKHLLVYYTFVIVQYNNHPPDKSIPNRFIDNILINLMLKQNRNTNYCAHVNISAQVKVTLFLHILHDYNTSSKLFLYPICLVNAFNSNSKVYPLGVGYIQVPSEIYNGYQGYIDVYCYYSPNITQKNIEWKFSLWLIKVCSWCFI